MPGSCYSACYSIRPDRAGSSGLQRSEGPLTRTGAGSARLRRRTGSLLQGGGRGFESLSAHRNPGQWHFATGLGLPPRWNSNLGVELNGPAGARRRSLTAGAGGRLGVAASQSGGEGQAGKVPGQGSSRPAPDDVVALFEAVEVEDAGLALFLVLAADTGARRGEQSELHIVRKRRRGEWAAQPPRRALPDLGTMGQGPGSRRGRRRRARCRARIPPGSLGRRSAASPRLQSRDRR